MIISNRKQDVRCSVRMEQILDAIYDAENLTVWRPQDSEIDQRGVDIAIHSSKEDTWYLVDEKCATAYWNKELNTYSCELTCAKTKDRLGWFAVEENKYKLTTHYMFVWVRALEPELKRISSLELCLVDKKKLQEFFYLETSCPIGTPTTELLQKLLPDFSVNISQNVKIRKSNIFPEFPVNVIFSKELLINMSCWHKTYTRFQVRDALRAAKAKNEKE